MPVRPVIRAGFDHLKEQGYGIVAYMIMPNHVHTIHYFPTAGFDLNNRARKNKGQLHKVFTDSFDAKGIYNEKFFNQKLQYIHRNPVSGKWKLVIDYTEYGHSSASFYENGEVKNYEPFDYRLL